MMVISNLAWAQTTYRFQPVNDLPVSNEQGALDLAWAGGINAGQYQTIDLNQDGLLDLFIFERTTNKITTFINV